MKVIISVSINHLNKFNYPIVVSKDYPFNLKSILFFLLKGSKYYLEYALNYYLYSL